jgi:hypothetical protein
MVARKARTRFQDLIASRQHQPDRDAGNQHQPDRTPATRCCGNQIGDLLQQEFDLGRNLPVSVHDRPDRISPNDEKTTSEEKRRSGKLPAAAVRRQTASSSGSGVVGAAGGRTLAGGGLGASGVAKGGDPGGAGCCNSDRCVTRSNHRHP